MADTQSVSTLIDSATSKIQQLQQAFAELENHRAATLNLKWKELEEHFHGLERSLKRRFYELEDQEKEYKNKALEAQEMLEKRKAAVVAKEHALLERLQDNRDAAVFSIGDALKKYKASSVGEPDVVNLDGHGGADMVVDEKPPDVKQVESEDAIVPILSGNMEVAKPHSELIKLCEEMDSNGLHKFISDNRKHLSAIREEIPFALKTAKDPARLVLNSLKGFYSMEMQTRDSNLLGIRRTCIMLMECFSQLLEYSEVSCISDAIISDDTKEEAKIIATEWKPKLDDLDIDASSGNSLEAHAFLQLLATYGIATEFDQEEIFKLIPTVSRRRQTSALCRSLGLSDKMPGVIGILVNSGRYLDAINMAYAFELTEQFSPVPLLKSYLKEARKTSSPVKSGNTAPTAQNEVNERELMALKFVLKCIEEHKLEEQYPVDPLQKRVVQLEKAKADKKRVVEAAKPQSKRPRASGGGYVPRSSNNTMDKTFYTTGPDRYPTYMYERPYVYTGPTNNNHASGVPAYNLAPTHVGYFGNGYQYQTAPYLH